MTFRRWTDIVLKGSCKNYRNVKGLVGFSRCLDIILVEMLAIDTVL